MTETRTITTPGDRPRCGAQRSRGRGLCRSPFVFANGRCKVHNGGAVIGPAHPSFKTGYRSKMLPVRLAARYMEALADPNLVGLREEIALIDARLGELLDRLDTGESSDRWTDARATFVAFQTAYQARDAAGMVGPLTTLDALLQAGADEAGTWSEIQRTLYLRKKLVDSESNRRKDMHQMLTTERAMTFAAALVASVREVVKDPAQLQAIVIGIQKLVGDGKAMT